MHGRSQILQQSNANQFAANQENEANKLYNIAIELNQTSAHLNLMTIYLNNILATNQILVHANTKEINGTLVY